MEATADYADKTDREQKRTMARRPVAPQAGCLCYVMPRWKKHCPESVRSFVVLIKNEINNDEAKYEQTGKDIEKN